jgi:hypothetical protein
MYPMYRMYTHHHTLSRGLPDTERIGRYLLLPQSTVIVTATANPAGNDAPPLTLPRHTIAIALSTAIDLVVRYSLTLKLNATGSQIVTAPAAYPVSRNPQKRARARLPEREADRGARVPGAERAVERSGVRKRLSIHVFRGRSKTLRRV